jgi:hypothetical protein
MNIVISQSMLFPWIGMLEQIRLADVFVCYDDVQFSKGGFTNRVQIKTASGSRWMTIPLTGHKLGMKINEVNIKPKETWKNTHLNLLLQAFEGAKYKDDALDLVNEVYSSEHENIGLLSHQSMMVLADYYGLRTNTKFIDVESLNIDGKSSNRVLDVVKNVGGDTYITGHGARRYLDHDLFENANIAVEYMDYKSVPYNQLYGEFTPYVSGLDLVANCGPGGILHICSETVNWREFKDE